MGAVLKFKLRRDRSEEIAHTLFRHINNGVGVDVDAVMNHLLADLGELPDLSAAEINAGFSLAFRVLRIFETCVFDSFHADGGGQ